MDTSLFSRAEDFIWKNARLLEKRIFAFFFLGGSAREVVSALKAYQNQDGGFGNALEPDKRYPGSTPVDVQHTLEFLDQVGMLQGPSRAGRADPAGVRIPHQHHHIGGRRALHPD